jgi:hypothetical protein
MNAITFQGINISKNTKAKHIAREGFLLNFVRNTVEKYSNLIDIKKTTIAINEMNEEHLSFDMYEISDCIHHNFKF